MGKIALESGVHLKGDGGIATPAIFVGGLTSGLLATISCPHSPKARRSTAVEIIKIAPTKP